MRDLCEYYTFLCPNMNLVDRAFCRRTKEVTINLWITEKNAHSSVSRVAAFYPYSPRSRTAFDTDFDRSLEHFPVRPLVRLPLNLNWLIPAPLVIDEFLVFCFTGIKLGELVALVIRCDVKGR